VELNEILQVALRGGASDIHLKAGLPPMFRVDGSLVPLKDGKRLPPEEVARMAFGIMNEYQRDKFKNSNEVDLAYGVPGLGRFRVNVFQQRGTLGAVLRVIPFKVMTVRDLLLPPVLESIALEERGLILVTGTTGSGKSTTLAAMIDHINANETDHIMTIEDPIEFLIRDKRSIVNQREVGVDTISFSPWTPRRPSTASSRCFRPISRSRCGCSWPACSRRSSPSASCPAPTGRAEWPRWRC